MILITLFLCYRNLFHSIEPPCFPFTISRNFHLIWEDILSIKFTGIKTESNLPQFTSYLELRESYNLFIQFRLAPARVKFDVFLNTLLLT